MNRDNTIRFISIGISIILVAVIAFWLIRYFSEKPTPKKVAIQLVEDELDIVFGHDSATITVFMYSNYGCPYCRTFFIEVLPAIHEEYIESGKVKIIMRLTLKTQNPDLLNSMKAAVCVNKYGNYEYLHQLVLSQSNIVFTADFQDMLNEFIDKDSQVAACMLAGESESYLNRNLAEFEQLGLQGTPSFVIENSVFHGAKDYSTFKQILEYFINRNNV
jgi:protein-disulfide isomerase